MHFDAHTTDMSHTGQFRWREYAGGLVLLTGLYLLSQANYLLFHSLVELFSIIVACGLFLFAWNMRHLLEQNYYLMLGIAYLFVAALDLLHTLAYKGMGVFAVQDANLPTQLWIAARYLESLSLCVAPLLIRRQWRRQFDVILLAGYAVILSVLLVLIFHTTLFPVCYRDDVGLTQFKIVSEWVISGLLVVAIWLLVRQRSAFAPLMFRWIILSLALTIAAEMAFTLYTDVYGIMNLLGHFCKILSFYLLYKAMIQASLVQPYQSVFRQLYASEQRFRSYFDLPLVGIAIISVEGRWLDLNEKLCTLLGYSRTDLQDQTWESLTSPEDWATEHLKFDHLRKGHIDHYSCEKRFIRRDGNPFDASVSVGSVQDTSRTPMYLVAVVNDITARKNIERDQERLIKELQEALQQIQHLQGLLPICPDCGKVRDDQGYWTSVEHYLHEHSDLEFKYTLCDACFKAHYPHAYEAKRTLPQYKQLLAQLNRKKHDS